jgi:hypothetical protein
VNLRQVSARNMGGITAELLAVREYIPHIKLIAQVPYLWQTDQEAILWLLDLLPKAGVSCIKDWTGKRTFSVPVDTTVAVRTDYTNFIARHIILNNLPLAIKIAGEVDALNAGAFVKAGADFLGVSYQRAKSVRGALL